jgi:hypothetical protein
VGTTGGLAGTEDGTIVRDESLPHDELIDGSDPEGAPLGYTVVTGPAHGTLSGTAPALTYQPAGNYNGADAFTFRVSDGALTSGLATVSIGVTAVNDPPVAGAEAYSIQSGSLLSVSAPGVLSNDSDIDSPSLVAELVSAPANGALTLNANGSFTYTSTAGYSGADAFAYRASDGSATSANVSVAITVTPVPVDTTPPVVSLTAPAAGTVSGNVTLSANATDSSGVAGVQFLLNGAALGTEDTSAPYSITWNSTTVANGSYVLSGRARDAIGNQATSPGVSVTVSNGGVTGLVAAYSFNEGSGTTLADRTGSGRTGTISGATWTTQGRNGGALSFDGVNDWVTVADANSLDLTTGMTLEAWVYPTAGGGGSWRNVIIKERTGGEVYNLYANADTNTPAVFVIRAAQTTVPQDARGTAALTLNTWTHLAATFDNATLRLYLNGTQVATRAVAGPLVTSTGALRIGGNGIWGEFFQGRIDDVRIYNRALTATEIQGDMAVGITP